MSNYFHYSLIHSLFFRDKTEEHYNKKKPSEAPAGDRQVSVAGFNQNKTTSPTELHYLLKVTATS